MNTDEHRFAFMVKKRSDSRIWVGIDLLENGKEVVSGYAKEEAGEPF